MTADRRLRRAPAALPHRDDVPAQVGNWGRWSARSPTARGAPRPSTLAPGDVLVLYTDGVIDADGDDERFGDERLTEALRGTADASDAVGRIRRALSEFEVGAQADDTAVLALAFTGDRARVA